MLAFLRFFVMAFVVATTLYAILWFRYRALRRRKILQDWKEDHSDRNLKTFIAEETRRWDRIRHRNLIVLLYLLPTALVTTIIYLTNFH
ncbi:hypothetical protein [Sagittula salina]|uniref:Uncharacterized protein n=1 Tax=Sagittula salina TaxID=2820268 RepID=A0A940S2R0_9RHOB|nr:hypothetical protein [Sagittula salina]MBP0484352.1 hypothetical protein [Sagittula salina]